MWACVFLRVALCRTSRHLRVVFYQMFVVPVGSDEEMEPPGIVVIGRS